MNPEFVDPFKLLDDEAGAQILDLLASGQIAIDDENGAGDTLLTYSIKRGADNVAQYLLQHGVNVQTVDEYGQTPVHVAAISDAIAVLPDLLLRGPNLEAVDSLHMTALLLASRRGNREFARMLVAGGARYDIHSAAAIGDADRVRVLLTQEPDCIRSARFPLDILPDAVYANSAECVRALARHPDININGYQLSGEPALVAAASSSRTDIEIVRILLGAGADRNARTQSGTSARDRARITGRADILALLN